MGILEILGVLVPFLGPIGVGALATSIAVWARSKSNSHRLTETEKRISKLESDSSENRNLLTEIKTEQRVEFANLKEDIRELKAALRKEK